MELEELRSTWDALGEQDPLWAILTDPDKTGGRWDVSEFMQTGREQADGYVVRLGSLGRRVSGRMLDFGCGVGRLTQGFAPSFAECTGVDIAASMIRRADRLNRFGPQVRYVHNDRPDLAVFPDGHFDLVFSTIVLQHMPEALSTAYIREFLRVCANGGTVVFQLPSRLLIHELPSDGFSAAIEADVPTTLAAGARVELTVSIRNTSTAAWPSGPGWYLALGNHWLDADGSVVHLDDGRASLGHDVEARGSTEITLNVTAPATPGTYVLELDMVQELVAWFGDRGSPAFRARVEVEPAGSKDEPTSTPDSPPAPVIEMFAVPRETILELVRSCGGTILAVEADDLASDFESFTYYVAVDTRP